MSANPRAWRTPATGIDAAGALGFARDDCTAKLTAAAAGAHSPQASARQSRPIPLSQEFRNVAQLSFVTKCRAVQT
jgi:hypothetical protein